MVRASSAARRPTNQSKKKMRQETQTLVDEIRQAITLLRRHL
jgi:hypothetical protein